jgi:hypothetical protein
VTEPALGSLERLDAREVWKSEPYEFTPWLRHNIALLGQALGIEIDAEVQQEVAVGLFSADLLGTDLGSSAAVLIENQLEQTDHSHLGQLLTYAGGLDSRILVWVSPNVREEHRQALTWLNENTSEDVLFFAVEIELLRIDGSKPAPHFKVVAAPNEWQKSKRVRSGPGGSGAASERNERYREFWATVIAALHEQAPGFTATSVERAPRQSWCPFSLGRTGVLNKIAFGYEDGASVLRSEVYIDTGDRTQNKAIFDALHADRAAIEVEVGEPLIWARRDEIKHSKIYVKRLGSRDDPADMLPNYRDWFVEHALRVNGAFARRVKTLGLQPATSGDSHGEDGLPG